jgi:UrcA family protein
MTRSPLAAAMLTAALVAPAATASDYDDGDVRTTVVSVADLDLSTGWGMDRLIKRLRGRIDDMCGGDEDCRDGAWMSADWQVARAVSHDQWRRRIAEERAADRRYYRARRMAGPPPMLREGPPPPPVAAPRIAYALPPGAVPVAKTVTTTTQTFTVKTTTVTLTYRLPPPDYRATWTPRFDGRR